MPQERYAIATVALVPVPEPEQSKGFLSGKAALGKPTYFNGILLRVSCHVELFFSLDLWVHAPVLSTGRSMRTVREYRCLATCRLFLFFSIALWCITEMKLVVSGQPASAVDASSVLHGGKCRSEARKCHDSKATSLLKNAVTDEVEPLCTLHLRSDFDGQT